MIDYNQLGLRYKLYACEVRLFTARVRSTREGNIYSSECLSVHIAGGRGYPIPGLTRGGIPSKVWPGGLPRVPP